MAKNFIMSFCSFYYIVNISAQCQIITLKIKIFSKTIFET